MVGEAANAAFEVPSGSLSPSPPRRETRTEGTALKGNGSADVTSNAEPPHARGRGRRGGGGRRRPKCPCREVRRGRRAARSPTGCPLSRTPEFKNHVGQRPWTRRACTPRPVHRDFPAPTLSCVSRSGGDTPLGSRRTHRGPVRRLPAPRCSAWAKQGQGPSRDGCAGPGQVPPAPPAPSAAPDPEPVTAGGQICRSRQLPTPGRGWHDRRGERRQPQQAS